MEKKQPENENRKTSPDETNVEQAIQETEGVKSEELRYKNADDIYD